MISLPSPAPLRGLVFGLAFASAGAVLAAPPNLFVSPSGSDGNPCSAVAPCRTIGHAVSVAPPFAHVTVLGGTYPEMVTVTRPLTLVGHGATIDATDLDNGIVVDTPGAAGTKVQGFTVANATFEGILVRNTSHVTIQGDTVTHNDRGAFSQNPTGECAPLGPVPGDCGEGLRLWAVAHSRVVGNVVTDNVGGILVTDETGPAHHNVIAMNTITDNAEDCGITLPSHNPAATSDPTKAGVYGNMVANNDCERNGGAGIGVFAPFPGTASYDNTITHNRTIGNGEGGINIHSHTPHQNVSGNVIVNNTIAGNGVDPDAGSPQPNGISILTVDPQTETIAANRFDDEYFGIYVAGPFTLHGIRSNHFSANVTVPVGP
jgi:nitrous oxidase accessory protein NosD